MQVVSFQEAVTKIHAEDPRFEPDSYHFLKEALDFTMNRVKESNGGEMRHVSGPELLIGFRDFALDQFRAMAATILREWGIQRCTHVGEMVFQLINEQVFGKQDSDSLEDFADIYTFEEAFVLPFLPEHNARRPVGY
ncbi:MAG: hypothetical protein Q7Q71_16355 [Verrucomicrobiota bacterium JB023]|nr:hypothetical protein [Verrucomicrobiota bacterium JB023]